MRRRDFIKVIAGSAVVWPVPMRAQEPAKPVVGFLNAASARGYERQVAAFLKGLGEAGFVDGQNVTVEYRWADGQYDRLPTMAADLVRRQVQVAQKRLQLLYEVVGKATVIAFLINPNEPVPEKADMQEAARNLGVELRVLNASSEREFEPAFANVVQMRAGGLVIGSSGVFVAHQEELAALAVRHAVPAVFENREFAAAGGLMSYGGSQSDGYRMTGVYVGRILKGEKASELPVQQGTKVEFCVNLKAARVLGLTVPNTLVGRADEVIE